MWAAIGVLIGLGFISLFLFLIGLAAFFVSKALYAHLVRAGFAHANTIRVVSFIATFFGICILGCICLSGCRFQR
jgi:hypothetical protein